MSICKHSQTLFDSNPMIEYVKSDRLEKMEHLQNLVRLSSFVIDHYCPWRKLNMTEKEYNLRKDSDEEHIDFPIELYPENAEDLRRLKSEAPKGKAKSASRASQEHINLESGGDSSTAQNEPPPNLQGLPVGGNHQFHNMQVNVPINHINQTDNYAPESAAMESGILSTLADNEPAEHTNLETGGGSATAQNEPPPNHQGLPVGGDHQFHNNQGNGSTNQTDNHAPESADIESGRSSTLAENEPVPDNCGNDTMFMLICEGLSICFAVISAKKGEGEMTIVAKIFFYFLVVFSILGIISLFYGLYLDSGLRGRGRGSIVARLVKGVSYVVVGLAVATGACLQLPNHVMVWVTPLVWVIIAPAIVGYAKTVIH